MGYFKIKLCYMPMYIFWPSITYETVNGSASNGLILQSASSEPLCEKLWNECHWDCIVLHIVVTQSSFMNLEESGLYHIVCILCFYLFPETGLCYILYIGAWIQIMPWQFSSTYSLVVAENVLLYYDWHSAKEILSPVLTEDELNAIAMQYVNDVEVYTCIWDCVGKDFREVFGRRWVTS